jgi:hypothetical protein
VKRSDIPMQHVIDLCRAFHEKGGPMPFDALVAEGIPEKVAFARLEQMNDIGLLEYGTSARSSWVADYAPEWPELAAKYGVK